MAGVGGEQPGEPAGDGVAPALPQFLLVAGFEVAEVGRQRFAPLLGAGGVDDLDQRPHHRVGGPRVCVGGADNLACVGVQPQQLGDQRARVAERDAGADAVVTGPATQDVAQPLTQPTLDALGRDDDQFLGERVGQWIAEQGAESVGEQVGAFRPMDVKRHCSQP